MEIFKKGKRERKKLILSLFNTPTIWISVAKRRRFATPKSKKDRKGKTDQESLKTPGSRPAFLRGC